ncbi:hypothetical protein FSP39_007788 [Pinctada imbricata]|uniref:Uncharacterized protein n=1 Tax=Pinctada imbricata TaxID=66713 RepID=A0AA89BNV2_PINIB|nr:hypothetical protein FSP39_007788 [Pinctada imbricata]
MVFVAVLAFLVSTSVWIINITGIISALPVNWFLIDMYVYSVLSFLFLISASLVANTFDFYQKMSLGVPFITIHKLIVSTISGYVCMVVHGITAFIGYRRWYYQRALFKRRKLIEEQDDYLDI